MNLEYISQPDIDVKFDKDWFMKNDDLKISLSTFKTMPTDTKSQTTLIKWSRDTMNPVTTDQETKKLLSLLVNISVRLEYPGIDSCIFVNRPRKIINGNIN